LRPETCFAQEPKNRRVHRHERFRAGVALFLGIMRIKLDNAH